MKWPWNRPNPLAGKDFMQLVPMTAVACHVAEDGGVTVLPPRFASGLTARLLQPRLPEQRRNIRVVLDRRGAAIWQQIDGQRPVHELVKLFEEAFPEDKDDAVDRVCRWLGGVYKHGFIKFHGVET